MKQKLKVGDYVEIEKNEYSPTDFIISKCYERKNSLNKPNIANIDQLLIVIAKVPQPDFILVDKLILYCFINKISPILVINKCELFDDNEIQNIKNQYIDVVDNIIMTSAKQNIGIDDLINILTNKISSFSGQSAVGKSTLINKIGHLDLKTNTISEKNNRGIHTTKSSEIYRILSNIYVIDTPGFTELDYEIIDFRQLALYYPEFSKYLDLCKYNNCSHINEKIDECCVKQNVLNGNINKDRYQRYIQIFTELKQLWREKYE